MEASAYSPFIQAVEETFGTRPWTPGEVNRKAKPRNAVAGLLRKAAREIRAGDLKKLIYELWEAGALEAIPPKPNERTYRIRLKPDAPGPLPKGIQEIEEAYQAIKGETRMVNVYFSDLAERSGQPVSAVHDWALARAKNGDAELSEGDFSLALDEQREACFRHKGKKFLLVGLFN